MKRKRHQIIIDIIKNNSVTTQEELQSLLREKGFDVTQATVSRDIKELMLVKVLGSDGQYRYTVSSKDKDDNIKFKSIFTHSVIGADYAGNICVVKCFAGTANAACAAIDSNASELSFVVGTIAGDDSFFVLCRTPLDAENLCKKINKMIED
jgi:transcriptional regulator of arginine metabolism